MRKNFTNFVRLDGSILKIDNNNLSFTWKRIISGQLQCGETADCRQYPTFGFRLRYIWNESNGITKEFIDELLNISNDILRDGANSYADLSCCVGFINSSKYYSSCDDEIAITDLNDVRTSIIFRYPSILMSKTNQEEFIVELHSKIKDNFLSSKLSNKPKLYESYDFIQILSSFPNYFEYWRSDDTLYHSGVEWVSVKDFVTSLDVNNNTILENGILTRADMEEVLDRSKNYHQLIPLICSNSYEGNIIKYSSIKYPLELNNTGFMCDTSHEVSDPEEDEWARFASEEYFIKMISLERLTTPEVARDICAAIYHTFSGSNRGKVIWMSMINQCENISGRLADIECPEIMYDQFGKNAIPRLLTCRTLAWFAKKDNPKKYDDWLNSWIIETILDIKEKSSKKIKITNRDLSKIFYKLNWLEVAYCDGGKSNKSPWYRFTGSTWIRTNISGVHGKIVNSVFSRLDKLKSLYEKRNIIFSQSDAQEKDEDGDDYNSEEEEEENNIIISIINQLKESMGNYSFLRSSISYSIIYFDIPDFNKYTNRDPNLTGLPNGVVETSIAKKSIIFREGKPEDYITMRTGVKLEDYTWDHPLVVKMIDWLIKAYDKKEMAKFFCKINASGFIAINLTKSLIFLVGKRGNNSKTSIIECMTEAWGDYLTIFPFVMITREPPDPSKPNPLLMTLYGPRFSVAVEAPANRSINSMVAKSYTGNDRNTGRSLYEDQSCNMKPTTTLIAAMNCAPRTDTYEESMINRMIVIDHDSVWDFNAPKDEEEQKRKRHYPANRSMMDEMMGLASALLWISFQVFPCYCEELLSGNEDVIISTRKYWSESNPIQRFYDKYIQDADDDQCISVVEMYSAFSSWSMMKYPSLKQIDEDRFVQYMSTSLGNYPIGDNWYGISLAEDF